MMPRRKGDSMGELTDKIKGTIKETIGEMKQKSDDPETQAKGKKEEIEGKLDKAKGDVKGKLDV